MTNPREALKVKAIYSEPDYLVPEDNTEFALTNSAKKFGLKAFIEELKETHRYVNARRSANNYH